MIYPIPESPVRIPPMPDPECRICGALVLNEEMGEFSEAGATCNACVEEMEGE